MFTSIDLEAQVYFYIVRAVNFTITVAATHVLLEQVDVLKTAVREKAVSLGYNIAGIDQLPSLGDSTSLYFRERFVRLRRACLSSILVYNIPIRVKKSSVLPPRQLGE